MAISLNDNILTLAPKPSDFRYGPWSSTTHANDQIVIQQRYLGLTVGIDFLTGITEYWYASGITNPDLVVKQVTGIMSFSGTNIGSGTEGVFSQKSGDLLEFRTLSANTKIFLTGTSDTIVIQTSGVNSYYIQPLAPSATTQSPLYDGDRWFNTTYGLEFVYIDDGDSSQWVEIFSATPQYPNLGTFEITSNTYNLTYDYFYYGINYDGPVDLFLPSCTGNDGKKITVKDELGKCNQLNKRIRISGYTGQNIDGNNYVDMAISRMALQLISRGNNWHII